MDPEPTSPYRPSPSWILTVRALFSNHFRLPAEITTQVLDHAHYWASTITSYPHLPLLCYASESLIKTPPLGSAHNEVVDVGFGRKTASGRARDGTPCREARMSFQASAVKKETPRDFWSPLGQRNGALQTVSHIQPIVAATPGVSPFVIGHVKNGDAKLWVSRFQLYAQQENKQATKAGYKEEKVVTVIEEPLGDGAETKNVVWSWADKGDGGDVVRSMKVGDSLDLKSNMHAHGWGFAARKMEIEVCYAV